MAALVVAACAEGTGSIPPPDTARELPLLVEVPVPVAEFGPGSVESPVVSDGRGGWLYAPGDLRRSALVVVDSGGTHEVPIGSYGEGPGEMLASFPLWLDDTLVIGHDLATRRVILWRRDGTVVREFRPAEPVVPVARGPGATLLAAQFTGKAVVPVLIALDGGAVRRVVPAEDTMLAALFADLDSPSARLDNTPAIGRWQDGVVVGNPDRYALALYRGDGSLAGTIRRALPPVATGAAAVEREMSRLERTPIGGDAAALEAARSRLEEETPARFDHVGAPRSDGRGRLWVVVQEGDAVAGDVYADTTYLGRVALDCPGFGGRWDLRGAWLLLVCAPRDTSALLDAEVRRYHLGERSTDR